MIRGFTLEMWPLDPKIDPCKISQRKIQKKKSQNHGKVLELRHQGRILQQIASLHIFSTPEEIGCI